MPGFLARGLTGLAGVSTRPAGYPAVGTTSCREAAPLTCHRRLDTLLLLAALATAVCDAERLTACHRQPVAAVLVRAWNTRHRSPGTNSSSVRESARGSELQADVRGDEALPACQNLRRTRPRTDHHKRTCSSAWGRRLDRGTPPKIRSILGAGSPERGSYERCCEMTDPRDCSALVPTSVRRCPRSGECRRARARHKG